MAKKTSQDAPAATAELDERSTTAAPAAPEDLPVRPGEDPWSAQEIEEARTALTEESERLRGEIAASEEVLAGLLRDGEGTGDEADTGTANISREHEMALASGARERLEQSERALARIDAGTYGRCESCGNAIGKARMQAFPRATQCVDCKQRQERR
ncbi:TraR/DksA family transcriptional regulator [Streptomyces sp. NPDC059740]|uniref:TraR/DksA family transcriptional regulator n=1 Tax=Streptomyces sp. NPDC059740 TaxID=3346926 RepID=UPI00364750A5